MPDHDLSGRTWPCSCTGRTATRWRIPSRLACRSSIIRSSSSISALGNDHKIVGGDTKRVLRKGMAGILPESVKRASRQARLRHARASLVPGAVARGDAGRGRENAGALSRLAEARGNPCARRRNARRKAAHRLHPLANRQSWNMGRAFRRRIVAVSPNRLTSARRRITAVALRTERETTLDVWNCWSGIARASGHPGSRSSFDGDEHTDRPSWPGRARVLACLRAKLCGFAHRRLAIIDFHDAAHSRWSGQNGAVITYNGEIYNYLELQAELQSGWKFRSNSDTETILAAYAKWGTDCLEHLRGMFAFALWDGTAAVSRARPLRHQAVLLYDGGGVALFCVRGKGAAAVSA